MATELVSFIIKESMLYLMTLLIISFALEFGAFQLYESKLEGAAFFLLEVEIVSQIDEKDRNDSNV